MRTRRHGRDAGDPLLRAFVDSEALGGILLIIAAALAIIIANSAGADAYRRALEFQLGPLTVIHWINDGLMAIFFLLVGLEIKREMAGGQLSTPASRALPLVAAIAGMAVPAALYLVLAGGDPALARGWAIPAATDIAFALAVLALLGTRAPASLKLLLTAIAIIDDIGAVAIIALAYTESLNGMALAAGAIILLAMVGLNKAGVRRLGPYLGLALALWAATFASGMHATVAGVLAAMAIPGDRGDTAGDTPSPLHRLEHAIHPWVAFAIVPLFGFANAGVGLRGADMDRLFSPLTLAVAVGLFAGKQAGIFAALRVAVALRWAAKPEAASWLQLYGVAVLCGIGFTMSLFIGTLAFDDPAMVEAMKIGVLGGSTLSAVTGFAILWVAARRER